MDWALLGSVALLIRLVVCFYWCGVLVWISLPLCLVPLLFFSLCPLDSGNTLFHFDGLHIKLVDHPVYDVEPPVNVVFYDPDYVALRVVPCGIQVPRACL